MVADHSASPKALDTHQELVTNLKEPGRFRIYVVDDEELIASTLAMILQRNGFDAVPFTLPTEALQTALETPPDLLVSDVVMPVLSGIDLAIQVKQQFPRCKVLLFSGQAGTSDLLNAAREEGWDFELLSKPVHPKEFILKVKEVTSEGVGDRMNPEVDACA